MIEWFVGVDWDRKLTRSASSTVRGVRGERSFTHTRSGLAEMAAWLLAQAGAAAEKASEVPPGHRAP